MGGFCGSISNNIDCVFAQNADFSGDPEPDNKNGLQFNAQVWMGRTVVNTFGTNIDVVTLTAGAGVTLTQTFNNPAGNTFTIAAAGAATALHTLSDDVGAIVTPSSNNIQLVGHVNEQVGKFSTIVAGSHLININPMSTSRWIVDPLGFNGTHTTIASALTSATSGDTIFLLPGTYTENLTLKAGVNITAYTCDGNNQETLTGPYANVTIIGKMTASYSGTANITGIMLQTNSDFIVVLSSANSLLNFADCYFNATNNTAISFTANGKMDLQRCNGDLGTTGIAYFSMNSGGLNIRYGFFTNSGNSTTASTNSGGGATTMLYTQFRNPITTSNGCGLVLTYTIINGIGNTTALTIGGTGSNGVIFSDIESGTASAISISTNASGGLNIYNSTISSTNTNAITGAGTITYSGLYFTTTSSKINTTTQKPGVASNNLVQVTSPGAYPYTTLAQDYVILVDTSLARTINLLANPGTGQTYRIKDNVGSAGANNITISPAAGNIDGAGSFTISTNYGSVDFTYNGTQWNAL